MEARWDVLIVMDYLEFEGRLEVTRVAFHVGMADKLLGVVFRLGDVGESGRNVGCREDGDSGED